jgi:hypothetical protein
VDRERPCRDAERDVGWVKSIHETRYGELLGVVMVDRT